VKLPLNGNDINAYVNNDEPQQYESIEKLIEDEEYVDCEFTDFNYMRKSREGKENERGSLIYALRSSTTSVIHLYTIVVHLHTSRFSKNREYHLQSEDSSSVVYLYADGHPRKIKILF